MPPVNGGKLLLGNLSNDKVFIFSIFQTVLHVSNKNLFYFYFFPVALDHFGKHPCWVPCRLPTPLMYKVHAVCEGSLNSDRLASKLAL